MLKIYEILQNRGAVTIPKLMEEFGVTRRTIQRDINLFQEAFLLEEGERTPNNEKTFRLKASRITESIRLTVLEMVALYMSDRLFDFLSGTDLKDSIDKLMEKLATRLSDRDAELKHKLPKKLFCTHAYPKQYKRSGDVLNELLTALMKEHALEIEYRAPRKQPFTVTVRPYSLVLHQNALYLIAFSEPQNAIRTYAVERIKKAKWLKDAPFEYPGDYDPGAEYSDAFGITSDLPPEKVRLKVSPAVSEYVTARQWHRTMKTKALAGGGVELEMKVSICEELFTWLQGFCDTVEVLEPKWLRKEVAERHRRAARLC